MLPTLGPNCILKKYKPKNNLNVLQTDENSGPEFFDLPVLSTRNPNKLELQKSTSSSYNIYLQQPVSQSKKSKQFISTLSSLNKNTNRSINLADKEIYSPDAQSLNFTTLIRSASSPDEDDDKPVLNPSVEDLSNLDVYYIHDPLKKSHFKESISSNGRPNISNSNETYSNMSKYSQWLIPRTRILYYKG